MLYRVIHIKHHTQEKNFLNKAFRIDCAMTVVTTNRNEEERKNENKSIGRLNRSRKRCNFPLRKLLAPKTIFPLQ